MPTSAEIIEAIPIILSLILIEGLLSVDNALAIAAMASHLPGRQRYLALRWGIIGAYVFRGLALACAAYIIDNPWLKIAGAAYLVHLMSSFFAERHQAAKVRGGAVGEAAARMAGKGFWATVASIELMDLSLSVDNVVAAVALSPKLWVVCTGVFIGILTLRFVAGICIKLIARFPVLESTAFLLIGFVGAILIFELTTHVEIHSLEKFIGIFAILGLSIWYSESKVARAILTPFVTVGRWPMIAYAAVSTRIVGLLLLPFRMLIGLLWKKDAVPHV